MFERNICLVRLFIGKTQKITLRDKVTENQKAKLFSVLEKAVGEHHGRHVAVTEGGEVIVKGSTIIGAAFRYAYLGDGPLPTAQKVLGLAKIDSSKVLGMEKEIGSLEVGNKADIIVVDMKRPHMVPNVAPSPTSYTTATETT